MNRKYFISSLATATAALSTFDTWAAPAEKENFSNRKHKVPPYLIPGDTIGITSPASYISLAEIQPAVQLMESWGFKVEVGTTVGKKDFTYGGTDDERAAELQTMLDDPNIKAIMCARGGYGAVRIIDRLNFRAFKSRPKWVIGFSDITVLHCHINQNFGIATLHSKMCNSFPDDWAKAEPVQVSTILSIKQALTGESLTYATPACSYNRNGNAKGKLIGGNLSIIANLAATKSDIETRNKILFLEDTDEYLYNIDRMFWNLKRSGKLSNLAGLVIGGFKTKPDTTGDEFGKTIYQIVTEKVKEYNYPVCFDFPVGHQRNNFALKCGVEHVLNVDGTGTMLKAF
ncbi:muramoyltetrapeptide carboxypeptidase [Mucilaginibacter gracilis]|uniref:Muramoyltetrapeptide carboxypeptidase n=1 Tax=Mucilaginibacter gracilis TaxID=423350 RepID=A0A495J5Y1_9SPHI|nr:LD-carboxypeptidase [Mucilaginibacter gracilis]RKR83828.1 muramoyltetrapeptide carboxypeptidase [Mucilaginibacter gracilis]